MNYTKQILCACIMSFALSFSSFAITWPYKVENNIGCFVHPLKALRATLIQFCTAIKASCTEYPNISSLPVNVGISCTALPYFFLSYSVYEEDTRRTLRAVEYSTSPAWRKWFKNGVLLHLIGTILQIKNSCCMNITIGDRPWPKNRFIAVAPNNAI